MTAFVVEVNEGAVEASSQGVEFWYTYRDRFVMCGKLREVKPACVIGGVVEIACEDREEAEFAADYMVQHGMPKGAVKVKRRRGRVVSARVVRRVAGPAVGVCGFGRCGSTMVMSMLVAGGCPAAGDLAAPFEGEPGQRVGHDLGGTCVKLLSGGNMAEIPQGPTRAWSFVWLDRDPVEQARSHLKFVNALASRTRARMSEQMLGLLAASYRQDRPKVLGQLRRVGPVLVLDFERVLVNPRKAAKQLREVWPALDVDAAAAVVHERGPGCLPDMTVELAITGGVSP